MHASGPHVTKQGDDATRQWFPATQPEVVLLTVISPLFIGGSQPQCKVVPVTGSTPVKRRGGRLVAFGACTAVGEGPAYWHHRRFARLERVPALVSMPRGRGIWAIRAPSSSAWSAKLYMPAADSRGAERFPDGGAEKILRGWACKARTRKCRRKLSV